MSGDLTYWQQRLADHFRQLASRRLGTGRRTPVFAIEHGLAPTEVRAIDVAVRAHISHSAPLADHALPWVVYAAEIGYGYSGDEYWQTFEEQTPGWAALGNRHWIRHCYLQFKASYGGAQPSGAWAEHFSIICWPITHAILPRDLQRQLARILYELRHSFYAELFESPQKLGQFIAAKSWSSTSRFQNFAQDTELVGQISAALLLEGQYGTDSLVHPPTLQRIGADLEGERRAREWLRGARRGAQERATIRALALGHGTASTPIGRLDEARSAVAALGIEPRLVLRPKATDASRWDLMLEVPDLSHLLLRFPKTQGVLTGSRCVVAGAEGRPLARGRCLHGVQMIKLSRWPREDEVLLRFEETDAQLEYLLRTECLLRPGPWWLFRIASDGLAYESRSLRVRPGERYILLTAAGRIAADDHFSAADLDCDGVRGALLEVPEVLTEDWAETLRRFGLRQAKTIQVWPAGLGAVAWDGEGHAEWLAHERPCFAIQADHPLEELHVSTGADPGDSLKLDSITTSEPIFVQLPQLPVGIHTVRVWSRSSSPTEAEAPGELDIIVRIQQARPWEAGVARSGPLIVHMDPPAPTLEDLWESHVDIEARGPAGRSIKCTMSLFEGMGGGPTVVKTLPSVPLPLLAAQWRAHFERYARVNKRVQDAYDSARLCRLEFAAGELGAFAFEFEREFVPMRWALRRRGNDVIARLIDDSGAQEPPDVTLLCFDKPTKAVRLTSSLEFPVEPPGGLFMARRAGVTAAILAVPRTIRSFADLGAAPQIETSARSVDAVVAALECAQQWETARSSGDVVSSHKRRSVLQELSRHILSVLGGEQWARAEYAFTSGRAPDLSALKRAVSSRRDQDGVAAAIGLEIAALASGNLEARVERLADLAVSFRVLDTVSRDQNENPAWLAELSLRVASSPGRAVVWAGPCLRPAIRRLLEDVPILARAARFLVIATDRQLESRAASGEVFASWGWA